MKDMKLELIIDKSTFRRLVLVAATAGLLFGGSYAVVHAAPATTTTYTAGEALSASSLNNNFTNLASAINANTIPPGTVVAFAGATVPPGWLLCDGHPVSRTTYAALFDAIKVVHGGGDGTSTFNLPDYQGRFLRGVNNGTTRDPDAATRTAPKEADAAVTGGAGNPGDKVGSIQGEAFKAHTHTGTTGNDVGNGSWYVVGGQQGFNSGSAFGAGYSGLHHTHPFTTDANGGLETRPKNANVNYIIKT
jgi:microcystin-dependent protein